MTDFTDILNKKLTVGDLVIFSKPNGTGSSSLDIGYITRYNPKSQYVSVKLVIPPTNKWSRPITVMRFSPHKLYRVDSQL
jgi:hypothetical protein